MTRINQITPLFMLFGRMIIARIRLLGECALFLGYSFFQLWVWPWQITKVVHQVYFIGMKSVSVVCLTAAFTGMVLGLQGYYTLVKFGSEGVLGAGEALTLIRELGPVMTALMVISRAGSAIAAELGIMRISEQIDALETMDIDPVRFLVSPRLGAALISFPLLTAMCDVVGIMGGYLTGSIMLGIDSGTFFARIYSTIQLHDVTEGFIKSLVFAVVVITVCCFNGFYAHRRAEFGVRSVSMATTTAVVISSVLVLITDYVLTSLLL
ncbi:MAG: ABC transporter permease [Desulfosarcina sp.]|nr:ABC transporter permease [Desulfobacterales bacterium]